MLWDVTQPNEVPGQLVLLIQPATGVFAGLQQPRMVFWMVGVDIGECYIPRPSYPKDGTDTGGTVGGQPERAGLAF